MGSIEFMMMAFAGGIIAIALLFVLFITLFKNNEDKIKPDEREDEHFGI